MDVNRLRHSSPLRRHTRKGQINHGRGAAIQPRRQPVPRQAHSLPDQIGGHFSAGVSAPENLRGKIWRSRVTPTHRDRARVGAISPLRLKMATDPNSPSAPSPTTGSRFHGGGGAVAIPCFRQKKLPGAISGNARRGCFNSNKGVGCRRQGLVLEESKLNIENNSDPSAETIRLRSPSFSPAFARELGLCVGSMISLNVLARARDVLSRFWLFTVNGSVGDRIDAFEDPSMAGLQHDHSSPPPHCPSGRHPCTPGPNRRACTIRTFPSCTRMGGSSRRTMSQDYSATASVDLSASFSVWVRSRQETPFGGTASPRRTNESADVSSCTPESDRTTSFRGPSS